MIRTIVEPLWDLVILDICITDEQPIDLQICVMLSSQGGPKHLRNLSGTLSNLCHKELDAILLGMLY